MGISLRRWRAECWSTPPPPLPYRETWSIAGGDQSEFHREVARGDDAFLFRPGPLVEASGHGCFRAVGLAGAALVETLPDRFLPEVVGREGFLGFAEEFQGDFRKAHPCGFGGFGRFAHGRISWGLGTGAAVRRGNGSRRCGWHETSLMAQPCHDGGQKASGFRRRETARGGCSVRHREGRNSLRPPVQRVLRTQQVASLPRGNVNWLGNADGSMKLHNILHCKMLREMQVERTARAWAVRKNGWVSPLPSPSD